MRVAIVVLCVLVPSVAAADAIGVPRDCPPGSRGQMNPHHGTGWCAPSPCETDADCVVVGGSSFAPNPGPQHCAEAGLCVFDERIAAATCATEGEGCHVTGYSDVGNVCHVRKYCVPGAPPPAPPPVAHPVATPSTAPAHAEPHGGMCSVGGASIPVAGLLLVALGLAVWRRAAHP